MAPGVQTKPKKRRSSKRRQARTPRGSWEWEQIEADLRGLRLLHSMQLELIRDLEKVVGRLKSRRRVKRSSAGGKSNKPR